MCAKISGFTFVFTSWPLAPPPVEILWRLQLRRHNNYRICPRTVHCLFPPTAPSAHPPICGRKGDLSLSLSLPPNCLPWGFSSIYFFHLQSKCWCVFSEYFSPCSELGLRWKALRGAVCDARLVFSESLNILSDGGRMVVIAPSASEINTMSVWRFCGCGCVKAESNRLTINS